jgi:ankyrin repeat protein
MKALQKILDDVNKADVFHGTTVTSVHTERFDGETALHMAAKWGDAEAVQVLVANGADINKPGEEGFTPLHYAAEQDHLEAVRSLVSLGAANLQDRNGDTPSRLAKALHHTAIYDFLVERGFEPGACT